MPESVKSQLQVDHNKNRSKAKLGSVKTTQYRPRKKMILIESRPLTAELGQIASTIALLRNAFVWETEK